jgi:hypothetical protein
MPNSENYHNPPKLDLSAPPAYSYNDSNFEVELPTEHDSSPHGKLPTYDEVQMEKILNDELPIAPQHLNVSRLL